jgi:hypothetical protein
VTGDPGEKDSMQSNGRRRVNGSRGSRAAAVVAAALLAACTDVSPYTERSYVRVGASMLYSPLRSDAGDADGPFPGGNIAIGTLFEQSFTHTTGIEIEYANNRLAQSSDLEGVSHGAFGGVRRTWNLEGRVRPSVGLGGFWQSVHVHHNPSGSDPHGFGAYADIGLDYMITSIHSIGLRVRDGALYDYADEHEKIRNNIELALVAAWRF